MLDTAFEALKKFDWGSDLAELAAIEDAAIAGHANPETREELENRLISALNGELTRDAQDYVCRKLAMVGTVASVPALAGLLVKKENSHLARFALERIPVAEAAQALREALSHVDGSLKVGIISSLGARRDSAAVATLGGLIGDRDPAIARSAALALGTIGNAESAQALTAAMRTSPINPQAIIDGLLSCAEAMLVSDQRAAASAIYKTLAADSHPRLVRLAATRGLLSCGSKQA